jgi:hypothetical protein
MRALIARQDAISRRAAGRINEILATHLDAGAVAYEWAEIRCEVRRAFSVATDKIVKACAESDSVKLRAFLDAELVAIMEPLDAEATRYGPVPAVPPEEEPRARARTSTSLPQARAQAANLAVRLMDLRARIAPLPPPIRGGGP